MKCLSFLSLLLFSLWNSITFTTNAQDYNELDKEGLRLFLKQPSAVPGKLNLHLVGLVVSDTMTWRQSETWITKIQALHGKATLAWDNSKPKRLTRLDISASEIPQKMAGKLNFSKFEKIAYVVINSNKFTSLDLSNTPELILVDCSDNLFTGNFDLTNRKNLTNLFLSNNRYSSVNISGCTALFSLWIRNNQITQLNISNTSALYEIDADNNELESVDISTSPALETVQLRGNALKELNFSNHPHLQSLNFEDNQLERLSLNNCTKLRLLGCSNNKIKQLELTNTPAMYEIWCQHNLLMFSGLREWGNMGNYSYSPQDTIKGDSVDVNEVIDLSSEYIIQGNITEYEWFDGNNRITPDMVGNGKFIAGNKLAGKTLICKMRNISFPALTLNYQIYIEKPIISYHEDDKEGLRIFLRQAASRSGLFNYNIVGLNTSDTADWYTSDEWLHKIINPRRVGVSLLEWNEDIPRRLVKLDFTNDASSDKMAGILDCKKFDSIQSVDVSDNQLTGLVTGQNINLQTLSCLSNKLTNLDLSGNAGLVSVSCGYNELKSLETRYNPNLQIIDCVYNNIQVLDVSQNIHLTYLTCVNNAIESLDVSNNPELNFLYCVNNLLTTLDISSNKALLGIYCAYNSIEKIVLPDSPFFIDFSAPHNNLKFSALPLLNIVAYTYYPQNKINGGEIPANKELDLSSELVIHGIQTEYKWYDDAGNLIYIQDNLTGKFIAGEENTGKRLICKMKNESLPLLTLEYETTVLPAEKEILTDHLSLFESPQEDYYQSKPGETFKIYAASMVNPDLVKIGLFKTTGMFVEDITVSRENSVYTCRISDRVAYSNYMIQPYVEKPNGIEVIERGKGSAHIDKLPFAFVRNQFYAYNSTDNYIASHLVVNTSDKNLYRAYIDTPFKVMVNMAETSHIRMGLFDLQGELMEDIEQSVAGKLFTCRVSFMVYPGKYLIMPYEEIAGDIRIIERNAGEKIMDRLPLTVDYDWEFRSLNVGNEKEPDRNVQDILLYPNPVKNTLFIQSQEIIENIQVYDMNGSLVKQTHESGSIPMNDLSAGNYVIRISTKDGTTIRKIIKTN